MGLKGKQFKQIGELLTPSVSETTARKADREGKLLNRIDKLEYENRSKDIQISLLKAKNYAALKKSSHN